MVFLSRMPQDKFEQSVKLKKKNMNNECHALDMVKAEPETFGNHIPNKALVVHVLC